MLVASNLECIRGERRLFHGVDFRLAAGEVLFLQGRNGSGKTSLLRMLVGLSTPASGEIRWCGESIRRLGADYRQKFRYLGHLNAIKEELTPLENLLTDAALSGSEQKLTEKDALDALDRLGVGRCVDLPCKFLSQGQKRRVALARFVHDRHLFWVLDEAFVALDVAAVELVAGLIGAHLNRGGLAVITTHQPVDIPVPTGQMQTLQLAGDGR